VALASLPFRRRLAGGEAPSSSAGGAPDYRRNRQNWTIRFAKPDSPIFFVLSWSFRLLSDSCGSPKCVATRIGHELEALTQNMKNWTVRFGKLDGPVLSIPTAVRGAAGTRRGSFSSDQMTSRWKIGKNHCRYPEDRVPPHTSSRSRQKASSGTTTCPTDPAPTARPGAAPGPPRVLWPQLPLPSPGQLRGRRVCPRSPAVDVLLK
jgi:hypothetical protein